MKNLLSPLCFASVLTKTTIFTTWTGIQGARIKKLKMSGLFLTISPQKSLTSKFTAWHNINYPWTFSWGISKQNILKIDPLVFPNYLSNTKESPITSYMIDMIWNYPLSPIIVLHGISWGASFRQKT